MKMAKKKKLENLNKTHNQYIRSLGIEIDVDSGEILQQRHGVPMPDYKCRQSPPTSDRISGTTYKKTYTSTIPEGKTISVPYNKGPYMIVDAKDFKTMGKKV
jgi:hypothetical protein